MTTIDQKIIRIPIRIAITAVIVMTGWIVWVVKRDFDYQDGIRRAQELSLQNNSILKEMQQEWREERKINEVRLKQIEQNQAKTDIDIAIIKVKLGL